MISIEKGVSLVTSTVSAMRTFPLPSARNPYPGLRPFKADEAELYRGREDALDTLETRVAIAPLTIFIARSGLGKSSFLVCRLIPHLERVTSVEYVNEWGADRPDVIITARLAAVQERFASRDVPSDFPQKPVLILDQFEDVFKSQSDREPLWDSLAAIVNASNPAAHVLISMREEWLGAWAEAAEYLPASFLNTVRLAPLTDAELVEAIVAPAAFERVAIDAALAQEIVDDLRTRNVYDRADVHTAPGLVQLVCNRLWEESAQRSQPIDSVLYKALGGAEGVKREFVWRRLEGDRKKKRGFTARERVLWAGISRYLAVGDDIKSQVTAASIVEKLRIEDLGFAGAIVTTWPFMTRSERHFLKKPPEVRPRANPQLARRIETLLQKGVQATFVKTVRTSSDGKQFYELVHDSLGPIFRQFGLELEREVRVRSVALFAKLLVIPGVLIFMVVTFAATTLPKDAAILLRPFRPIIYTTKFQQLSEASASLWLGFLFIVVLGVVSYFFYRALVTILKIPILALVSSKMPALAGRGPSLWRTIATLLAASVVLPALWNYGMPVISLPVRALANRVRTAADRGAALDPKAGLVAYWAFDAAPDGLRDAGPLNPCTFNKKPTAVTVGSLGALHFDPSTSCTARPFKKSGRSFTVTGWVRAERRTTGTFITLTSPTRQFKLERSAVGEEELRWDTAPNSGGTAPLSIVVIGRDTPSVWNHVAATYDDAVSELRLYVNGSRQRRSPSVQLSELVPELEEWTVTVGDARAALGQDAGGGMSADVRDVRIYDRAFRLADAERAHTAAPATAFAAISVENGAGTRR